ncbi:glycosyltransferase family 39 protein [Picosynechococcus sp. PCC 7117]|uniref:glycosyltransferase family 39 protein n=1 Tax=Picosynechococcus sp. PCC 7117 TaxID=195498 RepID=UPI00081092F0|nr:glycosyltransferase family 39 protein [Picosynechococcus sp. PCC 7117]ANV86217.1 hypothetical protein AWQ22_01290 [Picosynechococcus sp. PCC 7117]
MASSRIFSKKDFYLLGIWVGLGTLLRFWNLTLKSVWGDEWATLVFSLGHGFREIALDQLISADLLLAPLRYETGTNLATVSEMLLSESNHPPLYYWLTHLWLDLWSTDGELISIFVGRSPAAFFGVLLILVVFGVSAWVFKNKWAAHGGAIAMALSPYAVYLSQEARHYTLAMIWMTLSYGCVAKIIQAQQRSHKIPFQVLLGWLIVNTLGVASHYFMVLSLFAEGLVLLFCYGQDLRKNWPQKSLAKIFFPGYWQRIFCGAIASAIVVFLLLNHWQSQNNDELTSWLNQDYGWGLGNLLPPLRSLGWALGMIFMLPIEADQTWLVVAAAIALLLILLWFIPNLTAAFQQSWAQLEVKIFTGIILANLVTILGITYVLKLDITLAPRYHFIYFPALTILLGFFLAQMGKNIACSKLFWPQNCRLSALMIVGLMGLSSLCVNVDLAYRKPENNQAIAQILQQNLDWNDPQIFATHYYEIAVTRTQMGLAWALHHLDPSLQPRFLILDNFFKQDTAAKVLAETATQLTTPTQILMFNTHFAPPESICPLQPEARQKVTGYRYRLYFCDPSSN